MNHEARAPFGGDTAATLDRAASHLALHGYEVVESSESSRTLVGPGMSSTKQPPVMGATDIILTREGGELVLQARLDGVRRMVLFVWIFPPSLCLFIAASIALTRETVNWFLFMLPAVPWLFIAPVMSRVIERRTRRALDAFLHALTDSHPAPADS